MIGIGGIGMSALAQLFAHEGRRVTGSDRGESPTTELLTEKGVSVVIGQRAEHVTADIELVIYSDAIAEDNPERVRARELGIRQISYFQALGVVSASYRTLAVAGTHGKTTTTGMLTKILCECNTAPTAIIGSIVRDFESNYVAGTSDVFVVEACEYRGHLLELFPEILVINNLEWDHTDFFPSLEALQDTFRTAIQKVPETGVIVTDPRNPNIAPLLSAASAQIVDYTQESVPELQQIGEFNRANAKAAKAAAKALDPHLEDACIDEALKTFLGTWRRFEHKGQTKTGAEVYDDYAHHPTAVAETIAGVRERFPGKRLVVAFHPHLFSRTRDLFDGFVGALMQADEVIVAPIYAAREPDDPSISNHKLADAVQLGMGAIHTVYALDSFEEIEAKLNEYDASAIVITMGAGDIYKVADEITKVRPL